MWRTSDGNLHTVALPDPAEVFTGSAWAALRRVLDEASPEDVADLVERLESAAVDYWDAHPTDPETEADFVDLTPPVGLIDRVATTLPEVEAALLDVGPRWVLDVAMALDDLGELA